MTCERPPRSLRSRLPLYEGENNYSPPCKGGDGAEGAEGVAHTPFSYLRFFHRGAFSSPSAFMIQSISDFAGCKPASLICFVSLTSSPARSRASGDDCDPRIFCAVLTA